MATVDLRFNPTGGSGLYFITRLTVTNGGNPINATSSGHTNITYVPTSQDGLFTQGTPQSLFTPIGKASGQPTINGNVLGRSGVGNYWYMSWRSTSGDTSHPTSGFSFDWWISDSNAALRGTIENSTQTWSGSTGLSVALTPDRFTVLYDYTNKNPISWIRGGSCNIIYTP